MKMKTMRVYGLCLLMMVLAGAESSEPEAIEVAIPMGGNSWVADTADDRSRIITRSGVANWSSSDSVIRTFFGLEQTGDLRVALRAKVSSGSSQLLCRLGDTSHRVNFSNTDMERVEVGVFPITHPGYHHLDLQGLSKTGEVFAEVTEVLLSGDAAQGSVTYVRDDFYFGRRGPSVHLSYPVPSDIKQVLYFYSELTVPPGEDVVGSYFMANGFAEGYFGIQVNSPTERRILFSVWSPYRTDNPQEIPADQRITLLKQGDAVHAQKFGGEGSGGQSYRKYMWKAGTTYRFLLKGEPASDNATDFTAWFFAPEIGRWELMAGFRRPKTHTYLRRLHSFLENFIPAAGQFERQALYDNQFICDTKGNWTELTQARFSADATARKGARLDYTGGLVENRFFLKNCGFFDGHTEFGQVFTCKPGKQAPDIDFSVLP